MLGIWLSTLPRSLGSPEQARIPRQFNLVWIASAGPGGGGGGGGNQTKVAAPARQVGRDPLTVPTAKSEPAPVTKPKEPPPIQPLTIPAQPMAAAPEMLPGVAIDPAPPAAVTPGPGSGGGAGTGRGTGSGEGEGSGLGPGAGGGVGGGAYRPGNGVSSPELLHEAKPNYTIEAMRAKIQGLVVLECVVLADGTIGDVKIVRSLDKAFGLDQEAIRTAKQWRFKPGRRFGEPVPVFVTIELSFTLR
jgi:protein TonB